MTMQYPFDHFKHKTASNRHWMSLDYDKYGRDMVAYQPTEDMITYLHKKCCDYIMPMASLDAVLKVYRKNPETIVAFMRGAYQEEKWEHRPMGLLAHLPLNKDGVDGLFDGRLNTCDPEERFLCGQNKRPAAIYYWCMYMTPDVGGGLALALERMTSSKYRGLPAYAKAVTPNAFSLLTSLGFVEARHRATGARQRDLMQCLPPDPAAHRAIYDTYLPGVHGGTKKIGVTVAHDLNSILKVMAIRGAAYIEDQSIPYDEDVDGNDFTATHLLAYVGDEPAGTLRIRYFADFVKFERLAVLPRFRGKVGLHLIRAAIAFARMKGYRHVYGQVADDVRKIWEHFGAVRREGEGIQYLTDQTYYEYDMYLEPQERPVTLSSSAEVLVRPEGQWDRPGILEFREPME